MNYDHYPEEFDIEDRRLSMLVLDSAMAVDQYQLNGKTDLRYEQAINKLSGMFFELVRIPANYLSPSLELFLAEFYWPAKDFPLNLKDKTFEDSRLHSWLFAKDLSTFRELSEERREELVASCSNLHRKLLAKRMRRRRMGLAA